MKTIGNSRISAAAGFTLVELVVVIVIVAILATVAIPSYQHQIRKSRRTDAKSALLDLAAREERYNSTHNAYTADAGNLGYEGGFPVSVGSGFYQLTLDSDGSTFAATAAATTTGNQNKDTECANFTLNNTGIQGVTGTLTAATCWN